MEFRWLKRLMLAEENTWSKQFLLCLNQNLVTKNVGTKYLFCTVSRVSTSQNLLRYLNQVMESISQCLTTWNAVQCMIQQSNSVDDYLKNFVSTHFIQWRKDFVIFTRRILCIETLKQKISSSNVMVPLKLLTQDAVFCYIRKSLKDRRHKSRIALWAR